MTTWTVRSLLAWAREWLAKKGVDSPRLDAELLLAHALGCDRVRLYVDVDKPLTDEELQKFKPLIQRRGAREPVAYILSTKEFYGRPFFVEPGVFIPRPETELLVQLALEAQPARALDLCCGAGPVGVTLAAERPGASVDLVELDHLSAECARRNAAQHAPGRARVFEGDLFAALPAPATYDAVVANPPYLPTAERPAIMPDVVDHEPHLALFAGEDGLSVIRRIVGGLAAWLKPDGFFATEIDPPQSAAVRELLQAAGFRDIKVVRDLQGQDRHVTGRHGRN